MTKYLCDVAVIVRCKPLAQGPNGIPVPVVGGGGSTGGLLTVRATNPKQVNAQKISAGDIVVNYEGGIDAVTALGNSVGRCINDKGFIIIRFVSEADVPLYIEYLRHIMQEAYEGDNMREVFNDLSTGQILVPDGPEEKLQACLVRITKAHADRIKALEVAEKAQQEESAAWAEMMS
jgi:hypothetical protein